MHCDTIVTKNNLWRPFVALVMMSFGCGCFILSCITAMVVMSKDS